MTKYEYNKQLRHLEKERQAVEENMQLNKIAVNEAFNGFVKSLYSLYRKETSANSNINRSYRLLVKEAKKSGITTNIKVPYYRYSTMVFEKIINFNMDFKNRKKYLFDEVYYK